MGDPDAPRIAEADALPGIVSLKAMVPPDTGVPEESTVAVSVMGVPNATDEPPGETASVVVVGSPLTL